MTKQEAIENHRKMWNWIADQYEKGSKKKIEEIEIEYLKIMNIYPYPSIRCFLCQFCDDMDYDCDMCPALWKNGRCMKSEYKELLFSTIKFDFNCKEAAKLARAIADLPERNYEDDKK